MSYAPMAGLELPDDAQTIWRYIDLWKFESMLKSFGLYFVRSDRFKDTWDSVLPLKWREKMQREMCDRPEGGVYTEAAWYKEREIPSNPINCWNCDDCEDKRMWLEYTSGVDSLVIRSSVGRLKNCFSSTTSEVRIGLVNYGDHEDLDAPEFSLGYWGDDKPSVTLNPWYVSRYLKRMEFAYEKEIRASMHVACEDQPIDPGFILNIGREGI